MEPVQALTKIMSGQSLTYSEMGDLITQMLQGQIAHSLLGAILIALQIKGESVDEMTAALHTIRSLGIRVDLPEQKQAEILDVVGTGGDGIRSFNISTAAMFVIAAAGVKVAKHGSWAASSPSGAGNVIQAMGVMLPISVEKIIEGLETVHIAFMLAAGHYPLLHKVATVRKELGVRTMFNILGPLLNPALARNQLLGVFSPALQDLCASTGKQDGMQRMLVVHGCDGMDEITLSGPTRIVELRDNCLSDYTICPEEFGMKTINDLSALQVNSIEESIQKIDAVLDGVIGPQRDMVLLNAGAGLYCAGKVSSIGEGVLLAKDSIDSGEAKRKKAQFIEFYRV